MTNEVVRTVNTLPVVSAEQLQHVGRYASAVVMAVFEQIGGVQRFASWADQNPTDYYTKLLPKAMSRIAQVDHSVSVTLDDAITRLESQTIEADYTEVDLEYDL